MTDAAPRLPGLVCIGAQKAGTTWLAEMLRQNPGVWVPPFKEAQYFSARHVPEHRAWVPWHFRRSRDTVRRRHEAQGLAMPPDLTAYLDRTEPADGFTDAWYASLFAPAPPATVPVDLSPEYSTLPPEGVAHAAALLPGARFLYLIRHPVDRAISQLKMNLTRRRVTPRSLDDWMAAIADPVLDNRGDYATYVPRWQAAIPPDRLRILPYGRIARDPAALLAEIETFAGLPPHRYANPHRRIFTANPALSVPDPARAALRARLHPQFAFLAARFDAAFNALLR